jgi:glycosyltransferase involved in cell wall biosynthesis
MKIVQLITDNREHVRDYENETPWFGTAPEALLQGFAKLPDVEVHVVTCTQRPMKSPVKLAENIFFHSLLVPKIGWLRTGYQGCIRAARRKLREIRPDIVHGQGTERDCAVSAIFSGYPNVLTIHGNMRLIARVHHARPFTYAWFAARLEHFTIPRSDGVVCITNYTREAVVSLARKTWVVPNAVDGSFFEIKRLPSPAVQILCVATVDERKNQNALIRAMDTLHPQGRFELLFLGGANRNSAYVREFFELLETRPWCRYLGFADRDALRQYMASASGLVLPSLEDNCPMVILEAMAAGVPVAAARVGGVPDLVRHGETGLLFDPLSAEAMATAIKQLLEDRERSMTVRARDEARKRFHAEVIAARHLEIYREVASFPRAR